MLTDINKKWGMAIVIQENYPVNWEVYKWFNWPLIKFLILEDGMQYFPFDYCWSCIIFVTGRWEFYARNGRFNPCQFSTLIPLSDSVVCSTDSWMELDTSMFFMIVYHWLWSALLDKDCCISVFLINRSCCQFE